MSKILKLILFLAVASVAIGIWRGSEPLKTGAPPKESAADTIARAKLVEQEWDDFANKKSKLPPANKRTEAAQMALAKISQTDTEYSLAQQTLTSLQAKAKRNAKAAEIAEIAAIKTGLISARKSYAAEMEDKYLRAGQDFTIRTQGQDATTLYMRWVLIGRPFVYNAINDKKIMSTWRLLGFRTVIFTDGYDHTWQQKVQ
jgi:hypothetical protein